MESVYTKNAPQAVGPYSQAIISGNFVFTSGQLGMDKNGTLGKDIVEQTETAIKNLSEVLVAADSSLSDVVKTTCFLADINDFSVFNEIYGRYFSSKPARSLFEAAALPKGALVEIEAIAQIQNNKEKEL
ncbi:MAG: Rid family detoxifying hydrolase [Christensenellales bacterium]